MDYTSLILISTVLLLGVQHGYDLDHLSVIDSITRTVCHNPSLSKSVGILFSLGHGLIVTIISLIIGSGLMQAHIPSWLDSFGSWVSTFFLFIFGLILLWNSLKSKSTLVVFSVKTLFFKKIIPKNCNGLFIILLGALFAFSFDTFSQITLFAISGSLIAGWLFSGILGFVFMLGMMISDGLNGLFVSSIIQRADKISFLISRMLGVVIAFFSLTVGIFNLLKLI